MGHVQREFDVEVTDDNEAPTDIVTDPLLPVPENVTVPHTLTSLSVMDEEAEQRHSCRLLGPHGPLAVDTRQDGSMALVVKGRLDYETARRYDVVVSCSDGMYDVNKVGQGGVMIGRFFFFFFFFWWGVGFFLGFSLGF